MPETPTGRFVLGEIAEARRLRTGPGIFQNWPEPKLAANFVPTTETTSWGPEEPPWGPNGPLMFVSDCVRLQQPGSASACTPWSGVGRPQEVAHLSALARTEG